MARKVERNFPVKIETRDTIREVAEAARMTYDELISSMFDVFTGYGEETPEQVGLKFYEVKKRGRRFTKPDLEPTPKEPKPTKK